MCFKNASEILKASNVSQTSLCVLNSIASDMHDYEKFFSWGNIIRKPLVVLHKWPSTTIKATYSFVKTIKRETIDKTQHAHKKSEKFQVTNIFTTKLINFNEGAISAGSWLLIVGEETFQNFSSAI